MQALLKLHPIPESVMASSAGYSSANNVPSLDSLVSYLLAAKRSLTCADELSRANDIVTASRQVVVRQTAVEARTGFLLSGCAVQLASLYQLIGHLKSILGDTSKELDVVVLEIGATEKKLGIALDSLRRTVVDPNLRPKEEEAKSLLDFIDGSLVQTLLEDIRTAFDSCRSARTSFGDTIAGLGQELQEVAAAISVCRTRMNGGAEASPAFLLHALESSAYDMAQNFESLVKHHDLCVDALKHTEGAGAALHEATSNDSTDDQHVNLAKEIEAGYDAMDAGDHSSMLHLLMEDAHQVEEVMEDIHELLLEMKSTYSHALSQFQATTDIYSEAVVAHRKLEAIASHLAHCITQSHLFVLRIDDEKALMVEKQAELGELARFYNGFLAAYDNLLVEVGRRKDAGKRMKHIQEEAATKLETLHQEDAEERALFKASHGEFLPMDIWPGLTAAAPRYNISLVEGNGSVPDISASVVQKAIRRVNAHLSDQE